MGDGWNDAKPGEPCAICGRKSWCGEGHSCYMCYFLPGDEERTDCNGQVYHLHWKEERNRAPTPQVSKKKVEPASPEVLDSVYRFILAQLNLGPAYRDELATERGYTLEQIDGLYFRGLSRGYRGRIGRKAVEEFGEIVCRRVPGLYVKEDDDGAFWSLAGAEGMVIPTFNLDGQIVALRTRSVEDGKKVYRWISSGGKKKGASPGSPVYCPPLPREDTTTVRITEGEHKAIIATLRTGVYTIGVPGAGHYCQALPIIEKLNPSRVLVAFDTDWPGKPVVARAITGTYELLKGSVSEVVHETWEGEQKGVDDALLAGVALSELTGDPQAEFLDRVRAAIPQSGRPRVEIKKGDLFTTKRNLRSSLAKVSGRFLYHRGSELFEFDGTELRPLNLAALRTILVDHFDFGYWAKKKRGA